jgi:Tol biopolymer transport system component
MALAPGTRVGVYQIELRLGAGGMGEVYRARDTKLGRDVAIKILPNDFATNPERIARFQREAQVLAALNHQHIAQLYGFEEGALEAGHHLRALVMELVEGPTLADRLVYGPLPMSEALPMARQIAEALHAAHEKGITHRDLKPANVALTLDGNVKVLDFGLAKPNGPEGTSAMPESPTITSPAMMTSVGTILGTASYMSPEQARGGVADKRSDVWAFGCVLYEMLTGRRAFAGAGVPETLALVLTQEPDWLALPSEVPTVVRTLLEGCLAKDPRRRVADVSVAEFLLEERNASRLSGQGPARPSARRRERFAWAGGVMAAASVAAALAAIHFSETVSDLPSVRFSMTAPSGRSIWPGGVNVGAVSPDGRRVVLPVIPRAGGPARLAIRTLASDVDSLQDLEGTDGADSPFWAPDSRFVGFLAEGKLKKIDVTGGPPLTVCAVSGLGGGTWNRDNVVLFSGGSGPLFRVQAEGGTPAQVTKLDPKRQETAHRHPWFLPDGRHFLYAATATSSETMVYVGSLDQDMKVPVVQSDTGAIFAEGYLLFVRQSTLLALPFDLDGLKTSGDPAVLAQNISNTRNTASASFSAADKGVLSYWAISHIPTQLAWVNRTGELLERVGQPADQTGLELSPDGKRVALSVYDSSRYTRDIWIHDFARGLRTRLSLTVGDGWSSTWSPAGDRLVFSARRTGLLDLYQKPTNGGGAEQELGKEVGNNRYANSWSGDFLLYQTGRSRSATGSDIWALPMSGDLTPRPFLRTSANEQSAQFSPDGRWVVFTSDESGRDEVYVVPFPGPGGRVPISTDGGTSPRWRRDGSEIFYLSPRLTLMAAAVNGQNPEFEVGRVGRLFEAGFRTESYQGYGTGLVYDVARDGRFLINVVTGTEESVQSPITIITNWTSFLRAGH